jgi:uncharacterized protein with PIN domain
LVLEALGFERMFSFSDLELLALLLVSAFCVIVLLRFFSVMEKGNCPSCDGKLTRKKRDAGDYFVIAATFGILPFKRYKCIQCGWEGLRWRKRKEIVKGPRP